MSRNAAPSSKGIASARAISARIRFERNDFPRFPPTRRGPRLPVDDDISNSG
ncbi:hypothetical protein MPRS_07790 [Mycobacterium paraseoulense]|nr:hypothetical protein MPRS_07790 [Mycobacterium paraseoulense]